MAGRPTPDTFLPSQSFEGVREFGDQEESVVWEILTAHPQLTRRAEPTSDFQASPGLESGSARKPPSKGSTTRKREPCYECGKVKAGQAQFFPESCRQENHPESVHSEPVLVELQKAKG